MDETLDLFQQNQLAAIILSLLIYIMVFNRKNTFTVTIAVYIAFCFLHQISEPYMLMMSDLTGIKSATATTWYMGFALTDFLYVFLVYSIHDRIGIKPGWFAKFILSGVVAMGFIQLAGFVDRVLLKGSVLDQFYMVSFPAINFSVTLTVCLFVIVSVSVRGYRSTMEQVND
jgi:hypothetical protein